MPLLTMESYWHQPELLPKAIIRRLQAALAPSLWPPGERPPDSVTVDTLADFMADRRVQEVLRTGNDDQVVLAIRRVADVLSRRKSKSPRKTIDELWEFLDDPGLNEMVSTRARAESPDNLVRKMYRGPYREYER